MNFNKLDYKSLQQAVNEYVWTNIDLESPEFKAIRRQVSLLESTKILIKESRLLIEGTMEDVVSLLVRYAGMKRTNEVGPAELERVLGAYVRGKQRFNSPQEEQQAIMGLKNQIMKLGSDVLTRELAQHRIRWAAMDQNQVM
jgi:hypothetical protein